MAKFKRKHYFCFLTVYEMWKQYILKTLIKCFKFRAM